MNNAPSSPGSSWFPTFARFFRWLFSWRTLGRLMAGLAGLVTVVGLVCAEESWRGKRAWQNYKRQLEAQGEKLDFRDYIPPPVPDEQNFAMTPFLAPLFDFNPWPRLEGQSLWRDTNGYNRVVSLGNELRALEQEMTEHHDPYGIRPWMTDFQAWAIGLIGKTNQAPDAVTPAMTRPQAAAEVLRALEKYNPVLDELRSASRRPYARFNIQYDFDSVPGILLPHLAALKNAVFIFQLRASAELALDRTDQAWADTKMALYLADVPKNEPFLISRLVQVALVQLALHPIWEGLAEHKWSDAQLADIQQRLGQFDLLADAAMRGERAGNLLAVEQLHQQGRIDPDNWGPRVHLASFLLGGFYYQNQLCIARVYQQCFVPVVDAANQRLYPSRGGADNAELTRTLVGGFRPYHVLAEYLIPSFKRAGPHDNFGVGAQSKFGFGQTLVNEAIVACGLERYRLAQGQFPESLEPLSPRFLQKVPHDLITGQPLKYNRTADGQYRLYSVGWNEKDDGGTATLTQGEKPKIDLTQGDWVWQYPAAPEKISRR